MRRLLLLVSLVCAVSATSRAQELRGTLTLADGTTPAAGVIVEATDPRTGAVVASTLTSAQGYFLVRFTAPTTVAVRGLRIGQRPSPFGTFTLAIGEVRTERLALSGETLVLTPVSVTGRSVCGAARDSAQYVYTLLEESRKAIRATQLTSSGGRFTVEWQVRNQLTTLRGDPIGEPVTQSFRGGTDRPFVSLPPDSLAKVGYLETHDGQWTYHAPDATVLLSDRFLTENCFHTEPWTRDGADWVGIGFRRAGRAARGVTTIEGTMWLDWPTAELRRLEYRYASLPRELAGTDAGGEVEFLRLPIGLWLVSRWSIRMPRPTETEEPIFQRNVQTGVRRTLGLRSSGDVQSIRRGGTVVYTAPSARVVAAPRSDEAVHSLCAAPGGVPGAATPGMVWGIVRDSGGVPLAGARVDAEWRVNYRWLADWQRGWESRQRSTATAADGLYVICALPRGEPIWLRVTVGRSPSPRHAVRMEGDELAVRADLEARDTRTGSAAGVVAGQLIDSLRTGMPWSGVTVAALGTPAAAVSGSDGRFALRGLPPGEHTVVALDEALEMMRVPPPTARVLVGVDGRPSDVRLSSPTVAAHFLAACGRERQPGEAILVGEVRDLEGARRGGLAVHATWTRSTIARGAATTDILERSTWTASDGWFVLCGVPSAGEVLDGDAGAVLATGELRVTAKGAGLESGEMLVELGGAPIRRRDLIVGVPRRTVRLSGRVLDHLGVVVPNATVLVEGASSRSAVTDSTGTWVLDSVPERSTQLLVRAIRYLPQRVDLDPIGGHLRAREIRLERIPQQLEAQLITAQRAQSRRQQFEFRKTGGVGTFLDDAWIAQVPRVTPTNVRARIPRSRLARDLSVGGNARFKIAFESDVKAPGAGGVGPEPMSLCFPRWYVDGVDFVVPTGFEEEVSLAQAKRIEAYRAMEMPSQYTDFNGCGAIVVWTYDP